VISLLMTSFVESAALAPEVGSALPLASGVDWIIRTAPMLCDLAAVGTR